MARRSKTRSNPANSRLVTVYLTDGSQETVTTEVDKTLQDVFEKVCLIKELEDSSMLGIAKLNERGEPMFINLNIKLTKIAPKSWKTSQQGLGSDGVPLLTLHLMLQCYTEKLSSIKDAKLRTLYYHQLKKNFISYPILYPDDRCFLLAAYCMIAEGFGETISPDLRSFFPAWVVSKHSSSFIREHLPSLIHTFQDMGEAEALASAILAMTSQAPIPFNSQLYLLHKSLHRKDLAVRHCKHSRSHQLNTGECLQCHWLYLGVSYDGLTFYEIGDSGFIETYERQAWSHISNINQDKKKLHITISKQSTTLLADTEDLALRIFELCKNTHDHYIELKCKARTTSSFPRQKLDCNMSSITKHSQQLKVGSSQDDSPPSLPPKTIKGQKPLHNRNSIASNASSATSGIVSDRTCLSYYGSQEELLSATKPITSSQDSLLEPSASSKSRPVQRAISEPSKKFEQLRENKVSQLLHQQPTISRATSDVTVRRQMKIDDHIYENIAAVRGRLMAAAMTKPTKLSPRVLQDTGSILGQTPLAYSKHRLMVQSQGALNHCKGSLQYLSQPHLNKHLAFSSQLNLMRPSPSMEQLLMDYKPPPSYSERHEKLRKLILGKAKHEQSVPTVVHSTQKHNQKKQVCRCYTSSYQELDKLKEIRELPLISALCNDKHLKQRASRCDKCGIQPAASADNNINNRPISWHSETFILPPSLPSVSVIPLESY